MGDSTANTTVDVVNDEQEVINRRIRESLDGGNPTICFVEMEVSDTKELAGKAGEQSDVIRTGKSGSNSIVRAFGESIALALKQQFKNITNATKKTTTKGVKAKVEEKDELSNDSRENN